MLHNNKSIYLAYSLALKPQEIQFRDEFAMWLPNEIIDCHAHCNLPEHVIAMTEKTYGHMLSTFPSFTLEESKQLREVLFPDKKLYSLRFPKTFRGIDHRKANLYLLEKSPSDDRIALFGLPEDVEYTIQMLDHPRVSALKMYYSYVEPNATHIYEYFKPEILEVAEKRSIPIILHLPKVITESRSDLLQVTHDFPSLKIVIAHLGLSKMLIPKLEDAFREIAENPHIMLDTALNPSVDVTTLALRIFGINRIMFGSDEPLNLIRSRVYQHPQKGQRLITEYPYHWVNLDEHNQYAHLAEGVIHSHWGSMIALRSAIEMFPNSEQETIKQNVFYRTAKRLFKF